MRPMQPIEHEPDEIFFMILNGEYAYGGLTDNNLIKWVQPINMGERLSEEMALRFLPAILHINPQARIEAFVATDG